MNKFYYDRLVDLRKIIHKYGESNAPTVIVTEYNQLLELLKKEGAKKAFAIANNAIYFNDRSDYLSALYDVCKFLDPQLDEDSIGSKYIDEE